MAGNAGQAGRSRGGMRIGGAAVLVALGLLGGAGCGDDSAAPSQDASDGSVSQDAGDAGVATDLSIPLVVTQDGPVQGTRQDGVARFLGIPYAAPPVGDRRWRPPAPHEPWDEVLSTVSYGPSCPQLEKQMLGNTSDMDPGAVFSEDCPEGCTGDWCCVGAEDCLYANVWTAAAAPGEGRPVMIWIHGGGWNNGSGSLALYRGSQLARLGAVVVTFNYRLGILGYLAHPGLTAESPEGASGNYGGLDQVRLQQWVRDNIEQFGGDPSNVTIFGESAGASSVCDLVASPLASGLFQRAVVQSASCTSERAAQYLDRPAPITANKSAESLGVEAADSLGCSGEQDVVACMRAKSPAALFQAIRPASGTFMTGPFFRSIVDGYLLPDAPMKIIEANQHNDVPFIGLVNQNEEGLWRASVVMPALGGQGFTMQDAESTVEATRFPELVSLMFGADRQQDVLALYPQVSTGPEAVVTYEQLMTDLIFVCPLRRSVRALARWSESTYLGYFSRVAPGSFVEREQFGAVHSSEIAYVFGNLDAAAQIYLPLGQADQDLSDAMMHAWLSLAQSGDPSAGSLVWPPYDEIGGAYVHWDWPVQTDTNLRKAQCDYIDAFRESDACTGGATMPWACYM